MRCLQDFHCRVPETARFGKTLPDYLALLESGTSLNKNNILPNPGLVALMAGKWRGSILTSQQPTHDHTVPDLGSRPFVQGQDSTCQDQDRDSGVPRLGNIRG